MKVGIELIERNAEFLKKFLVDGMLFATYFFLEFYFALKEFEFENLLKKNFLLSSTCI